MYAAQTCLNLCTTCLYREVQQFSLNHINQYPQIISMKIFLKIILLEMKIKMKVAFLLVLLVFCLLLFLLAQSSLRYVHTHVAVYIRELSIDTIALILVLLPI